MSPRFLADENVEPDLVLGLKRRVEGIDIVRVQDVGLRRLDDPAILQRAADDGRVLISRDIKTVPTFAHARVVAGAIFLPIEKPPAIGPRLGCARMCP